MALHHLLASVFWSRALGKEFIFIPPAPLLPAAPTPSANPAQFPTLESQFFKELFFTPLLIDSLEYLTFI